MLPVESSNAFDDRQHSESVGCILSRECMKESLLIHTVGEMGPTA